MRTRPMLHAAYLTLGLVVASSSAAPPNVVMILGDDQAWTDFGFMGHPVIRTPHLDRLASEGLTFTRGYVPSSLCRPSLATFATGLFPHQHKITSNDPPQALAQEEFLKQRQEQIAYIERVPTLPRMLGRKGYLSLQTGKWWEGHYRRGGFTHGMTHGDPKRGGRHGDQGLKIGREGMGPIFRFIDESGSRPFFLWYAPFLPHQPHTPPDRLLEKYRDKTDSIHIARYWAMCEWFDETCGELLGHLEKRNLAENTLVVFVVDNGWIQRPDAVMFAPKSKRSPYDGGIRTPILLRWPNRIEPRRDETTLVSSIDLAPTILSACGLKPTPEMQGLDLLDREALARRPAIFGEIFTHNAVDIHDAASSLEYRSSIEGPWKLILPNPANVSDPDPELYNVVADPQETRNLAGEHPEQVDRLKKKIDDWWPAR
ncbi:MAG: sulfatase [Pirellulales bacterium]|nr:sulfatase [Pirellulales bacterium]